MAVWISCSESSADTFYVKMKSMVVGPTEPRASGKQTPEWVRVGVAVAKNSMPVSTWALEKMVPI